MVLRASRELADRFVVATRFWSVRAEWLWLTAGGALLLTVADAWLLERKFGLFLGGFLAGDYLRTPVARVAFVGLSGLTDAALLGLFIWAVLAVASRLPLSAAARGFLVLSLSLAPFIVADLVSYEVMQYLGDVINVSVLFDLSGRSVRELWAVAGDHAGRLMLAGVGGLAGVVALGWMVNRVWPPSPFSAAARMRLRRLVLPVAVLLAFGFSANVVARTLSDVMDLGLGRKPSGRVLGWFVQRVTDVDGDGAGLLSRPRDPNPWNAAIRPYAVEIPGNGIDENGVGGDLPSGSPYVEGPSTPPTFARRPPVVLVILETFRADVLQARVNEREVTPVLNELARRGFSSPRAYSHNGFTIQSRFHIFTGSLAGLRGGTSLIDDFNANGYETAFFSAQDESFGSSLDVGFERAGVRYDARQDIDRRFSQSTSPGSLGVPWTVLRERVLAYLASRRDSRPLFLHLNFQDTHFPYHNFAVEPLLGTPVVPRAEITPSRAADVRAMYANTVSNVDRALGEIIEAVGRAVGQEPVVVAIGDHGESLFDGGFLGHGYGLDEAQMRIPFIVAGLPVRVAEPSGQIELRDAMWRALGAADPAANGGRAVGEGTVFQYIGDFVGPRAIGLVTPEGRAAYDFWADEGGVDGRRAKVSALPAAEAAAVTRLVHYWERAVAARAAAPRPGRR